MTEALVEDGDWQFGTQTDPIEMQSVAPQTSGQVNQDRALNLGDKVTSPVPPRYQPTAPVSTARLSYPRVVKPSQLPSASSRITVIGEPGSKDEERFTVTIIGPYEEQQAEFKTRGKHTIKKVLAAACRTFELDYDLARLILLVDADDDEQMFYCEPDDTMAQCGVYRDARFLVKMEGEEPYEEDEDDEELYLDE